MEYQVLPLKSSLLINDARQAAIPGLPPKYPLLGLTSKSRKKVAERMKELMEQMKTHRVVQIHYVAKVNSIAICFNHGLITWVCLDDGPMKQTPHHIKYVYHDRYLIGKLISEHVVDFLMLENMILVSYTQPQLSLIVFRSDRGRTRRRRSSVISGGTYQPDAQSGISSIYGGPETATSAATSIMDDSEDEDDEELETNQLNDLKKLKKNLKLRFRNPLFCDIELESCVTRRVERKLAVNSAGDMILVYWQQGINSPAPWAPLSSEKDLANCLVYHFDPVALAYFDLVAYGIIGGGQFVHAIEFYKWSSEELLAIEQATNSLIVNFIVYSYTLNDPLDGQEPDLLLRCDFKVPIQLPAPTIKVQFTESQNRAVILCESNTIMVFECDHYRNHFALFSIQSSVPSVDLALCPGLHSPIISVCDSFGHIALFDCALNPLTSLNYDEYECSLNSALNPVKKMHFLSPGLICLNMTAPNPESRHGASAPSSSASSHPDSELILISLPSSVGSCPDIVRLYLRESLRYPDGNHIIKAVSVLNCIDWNHGPAVPFNCLTIIFNFLMKRCQRQTRVTYDKLIETHLEATLSAFYTLEMPTRPAIDQSIRNEFSTQVFFMAKRFFFHLFRNFRLEKAFLLAVDLNSPHLFLLLRNLALRLGNDRLAAACVERVQELQAFPSSTDGDHSNFYSATERNKMRQYDEDDMSSQDEQTVIDDEEKEQRPPYVEQAKVQVNDIRRYDGNNNFPETIEPALLEPSSSSEASQESSKGESPPPAPSLLGARHQGVQIYVPPPIPIPHGFSPPMPLGPSTAIYRPPLVKRATVSSVSSGNYGPVPLQCDTVPTIDMRRNSIYEPHGQNIGPQSRSSLAHSSGIATLSEIEAPPPRPPARFNKQAKQEAFQPPALPPKTYLKAQINIEAPHNGTRKTNQPITSDGPIPPPPLPPKSNSIRTNISKSLQHPTIYKSVVEVPGPIPSPMNSTNSGANLPQSPDALTSQPHLNGNTPMANASESDASSSADSQPKNPRIECVNLGIV